MSNRLEEIKKDFLEFHEAVREIKAKEMKMRKWDDEISLCGVFTDTGVQIHRGITIIVMMLSVDTRVVYNTDIEYRDEITLEYDGITYFQLV